MTIHLVVGPNTYQINKLKEKLQNEVSMFDFIELEKATIERLNETALSTSIMGKRIIWGDGSKFDYEAIDKLYKLLPEENEVYLTLNALPNNDWKTFNKIECKPLEEAQLTEYIETIATVEYGLSFNMDTLQLFTFLVGADEYKIDTELSKLKNPIQIDQIMSKINRIREVDIFILLEAVGSADVKTSTNLIEEYLNYGGTLVQLTNMLIYHFRQLLLIKSLLDKGCLTREIAKILEINQYVAQKQRGIANKYTFEALCELFVDLGKLDEQVKVKRDKVALLQYVHKVSRLYV